MCTHLIPSALLYTCLMGTACAQPQAPPAEFVPLATYKIAEGHAEILAATADGQTLLFSNSMRHSVGVLDLSDPKSPRQIASIPVPGEPTSVAVHDSWAAVSIRLDQPRKNAPPPKFAPGQVWILDLANPAEPQVVSRLNIGWHPDCLKIAEWMGQIFIVVAIENEPLILDKKGMATSEEDPGHPLDVSPAGFIDVLAHQPTAAETGVPAEFTRYTIVLPEKILREAGLAYPGDPQPEYVDIDHGIAAVSLQENNGVAVVDLRGPTPKLARVFSTGIVKDRQADLKENGKTRFSKLYPSAVNGNGIATIDAAGKQVAAGQRCPDSVSFSPDGKVLYSADEGEFDYTGGRGWSAWNLRGDLLWDDGGSLEVRAAKAQLYPEHRSENRGIEVEGLTTAIFGQQSLAFVVAERGNFVAVYDLKEAARPVFLQILATGVGPEGVLPLPQRNLLITANEVDGTLSIFRHTKGKT
jgi:hypothetical protein